MIDILYNTTFLHLVMIMSTLLGAKILSCTFSYFKIAWVGNRNDKYQVRMHFIFPCKWVAASKQKAQHCDYQIWKRTLGATLSPVCKLDWI